MSPTASPFTSLLRRVVAGTLVAPILVTYLYVGACGAGRRGFVMSAHGFGVSVSAAWCTAT